MRLAIVALIGLLLTTAPARAADRDRWAHAPTGIAVDRAPPGMALTADRDNSGGKQLDMILQFGEGGDPATLYIYRSTFPNPALWFERTGAAMAVAWQGMPPDLAPESFIFGAAPAPNGLKLVTALPPGARARSTAMAMAQVGDWMVKFRVTSTTLDAAGVSARLDALIAAVHLAAPAPAPHPLIVPAACESDGFDGGRPITKDLEAGRAQASIEGIMVLAAARGKAGLAASPDEWCRAGSTLPSVIASVYRRRAEPAEWVMLVGDSGQSVVGHRFVLPPPAGSKGKAKAALYANRLDASHVVALYDSLPFADASLAPSLPILLGQGEGLLSIAAEAKAD